MNPLIKFMAVPVLLLFASGGRALAHSLPDSKAQLIVQSDRVIIQFKCAYEVLELATQSKIELKSNHSLDLIKNYLIAHLSLRDSLDSKWSISVRSVFSQSSVDPVIGKFEEIVAVLELVPTKPHSLRDFIVSCDWIIHQIPNQSIFFSIESDWEGGVTATAKKQLGVISLDIPTGKIFPLHITLDNGSWWNGFKNMFMLGMQHIKEGTDHLLFIITLLLPACLLVRDQRWSHFGGIRYGLIRLLKIVTAFTIGHSVTLLIGALEWLTIPSRLVEVTIAVSILVSAIHAIRPLFYNKEVYIAIGFGLVHGLAFSQTLQEFNLDAVQLSLSVLGFNLGIEAMQLVVILITIPWFVLLSNTSFFNFFKNGFAVLVAIAAIGWMAQRITGENNFINQSVDSVFIYTPWLLAALAVFSLVCFYLLCIRQPKIFSMNRDLT